MSEKVSTGLGMAGGMLGCVVWLGLGLVQLAAIMAQLESFLGWPWFIAGPVGLFLAYIPVVGSIIGFFGAKDVFGWEWWQAGLLFFGIMIVSLLVTLGSAAARRSS